MSCCASGLLFVLMISPTYKQRLTRRRLLLLGASHVAPSKNPANSVVAPVAVLGSETVGLLGTQKLSTHGTRAFRLAKHDSPKRSFWVSSATTSNNIAMHLLVTVMPAMLQTLQQTSWPPIWLHQTRRHLMYMPRHQSKHRSSQSIGQLALLSTVKSLTPRPKPPWILLPFNRRAARQSSRQSVPTYGASLSASACYLPSLCVDFAMVYRPLNSTCTNM